MAPIVPSAFSFMSALARGESHPLAAEHTPAAPVAVPVASDIVEISPTSMHDPEAQPDCAGSSGITQHGRASLGIDQTFGVEPALATEIRDTVPAYAGPGRTPDLNGRQGRS